jgi:hypothetical protein
MAKTAPTYASERGKLIGHQGKENVFVASQKYHDGARYGLIELNAVLRSSWKPAVLQIPVEYSTPTIVEHLVLEGIEGKAVNNWRRYEPWREGNWLCKMSNNVVSQTSARASSSCKFDYPTKAEASSR